MSKGFSRLVCAGLVLLVFCAISALAQDSDQMSNKSHGKSITGCVQKGEEAGGYTLKADDGTTYELMSDSVNLSEHVGHKVTLTGQKTHANKAEEQQKEASEKQEAGGGKFTDFKVSDLKMVGDSCQ